MGISVNKVLGYGIEKFVPDDPRLNPNGFIRDPNGDWSKDGYREYLFKRFPFTPSFGFGPHLECWAWSDMGKNSKCNQHLNFWDPWESIVWKSGGPLIIVPPAWVEKWRRRGDNIDFYEEKTAGRESDRVVSLRDPIYPEVLWEHIESKEVTTDWWMKELHPNEYRIFVPWGVRIVAEYLEIFKDPATIDTLEPMLYTYWA